jgi:hypothetical protein
MAKLDDAAQHAPLHSSRTETQMRRLSLTIVSLIALSLAACATQPPPPPDIPPPPKRKLDAKTQLETGRTY